MRPLIATAALAAALLAGAAGIAGAQSGGLFHIYLVVWRGETDVEHGFRAHLYERGIPARYTLRNINQDRSRIPEIVAEIRAAKPDLVHTFGTSATLGVLGPHTDAQPGAHVEGIPGVFSIVAYPIEAKIVEQFDPPGRPITGTAFLAPIENQIDAILAYRPIDTLGVIYNSLERNSVINVTALRAGCEARNIKLVELPVPLDADGRPDVSRLDALADDLVREGVDFLYMGPDSFVTVNSERISTRAAEHGIPTFAGTGATFSRSRRHARPGEPLLPDRQARRRAGGTNSGRRREAGGHSGGVAGPVHAAHPHAGGPGARHLSTDGAAAHRPGGRVGGWESRHVSASSSSRSWR